ncbi:glycoside hydrolase family 95 protein [Paenibacillus mesophilus]|uniref:glycosyl hydrolase family 95 catalytic domain-containing protein n=1 Tax=Paenibacillus mesophilus TaxID=2582849 RepID=UPI00110DAA8E|nr:glycoside hydrolase N-terminal domain-containing protein [Paenibacillus mesophilus]TMV44731.1 glycoside hydrolase family 95 protein [Paenibacillus mesophilus]
MEARRSASASAWKSGHGRNRLEMRRPSSWWGGLWREALPSGNGIVGAAVYGGVRAETVLINHAELWHAGLKGQLPDVSSALPDIRRRMREGSYMEAKTALTEALAEREYESKREVPLPLCDIKLTMSAPEAFRRYRRSLDMETGEVSIRWESAGASYERVLFVSRRDDMIVYELRASGDGGTIEAEIGLMPHDKADSSPSIPPYVESSAETMADGEYLYYSATNDDGCDFGAVLRIIPNGGQVVCSGGKAAISGTDRVLLLIQVFMRGDRAKDWPRLAQRLGSVAFSYEELLERHASLHRPLFLSAEIRLGREEAERSNEELLLDAYEGEGLPPGLAEKMWQFGRYLFISATRADGMPVPLYGLWGGEYRLMWSHFMANENIQMMYWHASVGGLSELVPALFRYYEGMIDVFRDNARKLYGCRGIFIPAGTTPKVGTPFQTVPVILYWTGAAGWLAQHFYEYGLFTGDRTYLKERALPFMREAALFYKDFFEEGEDGYYRSYPSVSPENTPANFFPPGPKPLAHPMPCTINATLDFAIAKELLTNLIEGSREAGVYGEELGGWEAMLRRIPPYEINDDGAVKEWMHPHFEDNYRHRHISHSYPLFPGKEITRQSDSVLFEAFGTAIGKRLVIGIGDQTAWSLAHLANLYARMEEGDRALECLELLARSCLLGNLYTVHNDWRSMGVTLPDRKAPVQLDGNMGWVSAVQEMLLYVSPKLVKLLPALPAAWSNGAVRGLRFCAGSISLEWDAEHGTFAASLHAERDASFRVKTPPMFAGCRWRIDKAGGGSTGGACEDIWDVSLQAGDKLQIDRNGSGKEGVSG